MVIHPDRNLRNADWTKRIDDMAMANVEQFKTAAQFAEYLRTELEMTVEQFKQLPVYTNSVRRGIGPAWLADL